MFDSEAGGPDAAATLSLVSAAHRQVRERECWLVELAAHWADLHHPDSQAAAQRTLPGGERSRQLGGEGSPEVLEFAAGELAARLETSYGSARSLMADALDLRHRHPELWQLIVTGGVPSWKARKVAQATRYLSRSSAMQVDAAVARAITGLAWARFETLLAAKIIEADPHAAEEQAKIWEAERFVRAGRTNQSGLKLLIGKANAGNVILFIATVNRIAEILRLQGDMESADVRRSTAIGILAQPALALQLLWEFRDEQHPAAEPQQPDEPIYNDPKASDDNSTGCLDDHVDGGPEAESADSTVDASAGCGSIFQPPGGDVAKLRPQVVLHIHLSEEALLSYQNGKSRFGSGVGRFEGVGPVTMGQVRRFLAGTGCQIKVQPVIDPDDAIPVDSYEIPRRIRDAMFLRMPASCFPYATAAGRLELDHTKGYVPAARGGPPGQTGIHNLGPLIRFEHRIKTHGRGQVRQPEPGIWLWQSPHHALGTHTLGNGPFARRLWRATTSARKRARTKLVGTTM